MMMDTILHAEIAPDDDRGLATIRSHRSGKTKVYWEFICFQCYHVERGSELHVRELMRDHVCVRIDAA
jgi:hypothetical protein